MNLNERSARFVTRAGDRVTIDTSKAYGEPLLANRRKAVPKAKVKLYATETQNIRLNLKSLAHCVALEVGLSKTQSEAVVKVVLDRIKVALINGDDVQLAQFGTFKSVRVPDESSPDEPANTLEFHAAKELVNALR